MKGLSGKIRGFLHETMLEINRCTWPKRAELFESTILTIVVIILLTSFVFMVDQASRFLIDIITKL